MQTLSIREDVITGATYVEGLTQFKVDDADDCFGYLVRGERNRATR